MFLICLPVCFKDNSFKEWSFQRAITIQTYDAYDPIPVPLNIIYNIISMLLWCVKRGGKKTSNDKGKNGKPLIQVTRVSR